MLAGHCLHLLTQLGYLRAFLFIGWGGVQGQQITQGSHHQMDLAAFTPVMAAITGASSALGRGL